VPPHRLVQVLGPHHRPCTPGLVFRADGLAPAALVVPVSASPPVRVGDAHHGPPAAPAREQAAEQVEVPRVVPGGDGRVVGELRRGQLVGLLVDEGWHRDRDPLLARTLPPAGQGVGPAAPAVRVRRSRQDVAVRVAGAYVDGFRGDVADDRAAPPASPASRPPRAVAQAADDRTDRHPFVDQPAVHHPHHGRLGVIDDQVAGHVVPLGDMAVTIGGAAGA
jgi:hypothetical protein